jgi:hypothetical protein
MALISHKNKKPHKKKAKDLITRNTIYHKLQKDLLIENTKHINPQIGLLKKLHLPHSIKDSIEVNDKLVNSIVCNPGWGICTFDITFDSQILTYFAYRTPKLNIINDYFDASSTNATSNDIMVYRSTHYCELPIGRTIYSALSNNKNIKGSIPLINKKYYSESEVCFVWDELKTNIILTGPSESKSPILESKEENKGDSFDFNSMMDKGKKDLVVPTFTFKH